MAGRLHGVVGGQRHYKAMRRNEGRKRKRPCGSKAWKIARRFRLIAVVRTIVPVAWKTAIDDDGDRLRLVVDRGRLVVGLGLRRRLVILGRRFVISLCRR